MAASLPKPSEKRENGSTETPPFSCRSGDKGEENRFRHGNLFDFIKKEKGLVFIAAGNIGSGVLGALLWSVLAVLLQVGDFGEVNYYIALASIPATIGMFGLSTAVTTFLAKGEDEIVYESNFVILISSLVLSAMTWTLKWFFPLIIMSGMFFGISLAEILGRKKYIEYALVMVTYRLVQIVSALALYSRLGILGILIGHFLGPIVFSYRFFNSFKRFGSKIEYIKEKGNFVLHSFGLRVTECLSLFMDKVIIGVVFGFYSLGIYQLAFQFSLFLGMIPASLYSYLLPEEASGKKRREVKVLGLAFAFMATLSTILLSPYIVDSFFAKFSDSIDVIRVMCISIIPATMTKILNASFLGQENSKKVLMGGLIYIASLLLGFLALGSSMGTVGLAFSVVSASVIQAGFLATSPKGRWPTGRRWMSLSAARRFGDSLD